MLLFVSPHTDSTIFRYSPGKFFVTRTDYTLSRYSPVFDHFLVHTLILPFFGTRSDSYSILARILPLPGSRPDSNIFLSSHWYYHFSTLACPGFDHFPVLKLILPFFGTRSDSYSILARILPLPSSRPDSIIFSSSHWFYHFSILTGKDFCYSHGSYPFPVLSRIRPFSGTHTDSTIFRYSFGQLFDTRSNSTFTR